MFNWFKLGKSIYKDKNIKEYKRLIVFLIRILFNKSKMDELFIFFNETKLKNSIIKKEPFFIEVATRMVLFKDSKLQERCKIIKNHFNIIIKRLHEKLIKEIYLNIGFNLWEEEYNDKILHVKLEFESGQKKEGLLSLMLNLNNMKIYQMIFWLGYDENNQEALYIGAMQGSNEAEANNLIKGLTKHFYGYRTKNLILYMTRCLAKSLDINKIYAVSNKGYYANNHLRIDRKLKTSLDEFWEETGGKLTTDYRFYELPVEEYRKSLDEIKTHKRSQYRNRFKKLDEVEEKIIETVRSFRL